jgi:hypothetical protein
MKRDRTMIQRVQPRNKIVNKTKRNSIETPSLLEDMNTYKKQKLEGVNVKDIHARHLQRLESGRVLLDNVEDMYLYRLNFE